MKAKEIKQKLVELGAWDEFKKKMKENKTSIRKYFAYTEGLSFKMIIIGAFPWGQETDLWNKICNS